MSMEFPRQEYWSGLQCLPPGHLPDSGIEPASLTSPARAGQYFTTSTIWEAQEIIIQLTEKNPKLVNSALNLLL